MQLVDASLFHFIFVFAQGAALGVLLCFVTLECMARAAATREANAAADGEAIDAEWADVEDDPALSRLRRLV